LASRTFIRSKNARIDTGADLQRAFFAAPNIETALQLWEAGAEYDPQTDAGRFANRQVADLMATMVFAKPADVRGPYRRDESEIEAGTPDECGICMDPLEIQRHALLQPCRHEYHLECIASWFAGSGRQECPYCRARVDRILTTGRDTAGGKRGRKPDKDGGGGKRQEAGKAMFASGVPIVYVTQDEYAEQRRRLQSKSRALYY